MGTNRVHVAAPIWESSICLRRLAVTATVASLLVGCSAEPAAHSSASHTIAEASNTATSDGLPDSSPSPSPTPAAARRRAKADSLTIEQQAGQLFMIGVSTSGLDAKTRKAIESGSIGAVVLLGNSTEGASRISAITSELGEIQSSGMPLLIAVDQEGGHIQRLKGPGFSDIPNAVEQGPGWAKTFLDTVRSLTGSTPGIYMNDSALNGYDWSVVAGEYPLWYADPENYNTVYMGYIDPAVPGGPRHAHHKELVKVRGHDRQKIQALQQVQIRVFGKLQHPGIKIEPAAFTVEKTLGPKIAFDAGQIEFFSRLNAVGTGIGTLNLRDIVSDVNQPGQRCRFGILFGMRVGCHRLFLTMLRD